MLTTTWPPAVIQLVFVIRQAYFSMYSKFVYLPQIFEKNIKIKKKTYYIIQKIVMIPATLRSLF